MKIGYFLSMRGVRARRELVDQARARRGRPASTRCGSPTTTTRGTTSRATAPFVWSVIGALVAGDATCRSPPRVTCPTMRIHPAIIAQAAATSAVLLDGRFNLGVGSGEALNEHILGDRWPEADVRLEMLEEAVEVIRTLWQGGQRSHHGRHYTVENARVYDLPDEPPPILVSGFGPKAIELAARIGDGFVHDLARQGRDRPVPRRAAATARSRPARRSASWPTRTRRASTAHRLWPNEALPGELAQVLPTPGALRAGVRARHARHARRRPSAPTSSTHVAVAAGVRRRRRRRALRPADRPRAGRVLRHAGRPRSSPRF